MPTFFKAKVYLVYFASGLVSKVIQKSAVKFNFPPGDPRRPTTTKKRPYFLIIVNGLIRRALLRTYCLGQFEKKAARAILRRKFRRVTYSTVFLVFTYNLTMCFLVSPRRTPRTSCAAKTFIFHFYNFPKTPVKSNCKCLALKLLCS